MFFLSIKSTKFTVNLLINVNKTFGGFGLILEKLIPSKTGSSDKYDVPVSIR